MTKNDFFEAMNNIDASLIERADGEVTVKRKRPILKIAAVAASFAVLAAGIAVILPALMGEPDENIVTDRIVWENVFELFDPNSKDEGGLKIWYEESTAYEYAFSDIIGEGYDKYEKGNSFPLEKTGEFIGEKLGETEVRTGWHIVPEDRDYDVRTVKAEVYEIKGVSPDAAVAIKYLEKAAAESTEHYYAAVNTEYEFSTLAAFLDDFSAAVHMDIGRIGLLRAHIAGVSRGNIERYRMTDAGSAELCKLLLTLDGEAETENAYDAVDEKLKNCDILMRFTLIMDFAGTYTNRLYVLNNGYIAIEGFGKDIVFFNVGRENTDLFYETMKRYGEQIINPIDPDGDGLVEETTSAPVNEVVPE